MSALDIRKAKQSLTWWLREWGVSEAPERKAQQFIDDMVDRGWVMDAAKEARPQPPRARQACTRCGGIKPGCACTREHLAATYDDEPATPPTTTGPDGVRAALRQARAQHTDHPPAQQDGIEESK